jgi:hypothetical protein
MSNLLPLYGRPFGVLGIPDVEWARSIAVQASKRAATAALTAGNRKWQTVPAITLTASPLIVATFDMFAFSTGRFFIRSGGVLNGDSPALFQYGVSHGVGVTAADYSQIQMLTVSGGEAPGTVVTVAVDLPTVGFTAVVGSTTRINLLMTGVSGAHVAVPVNGITFDVQEY